MQGEQLPVYPSNIQGELRLILQNKDLFLLCYKYLEDYRRLNEEQNRIITKDFIENQIRIGEDELDELQIELTSAENKLGVRTRHNETLHGQLSIRGMSSFGDGSPRRKTCRSPIARRCPELLSAKELGPKDLSLFENIALAIEEIQREIKNKLKPLCEFYRDLFYLQLHLTLVLTQVCNYTMPLVTENVGLIDRIFFWADRPEFELIKKAGEIADRLKDVYTRTQSILTLLVENVMFLQNKVELQRNLERKFQERLERQQYEKDTILRRIHWSRLEMDLLEEDNDRLVGIIVKLDPKFVRTDHFNELADYSVRRNYLEGRLTPRGYQAHQIGVINSPKGNQSASAVRYANNESNSSFTNEMLYNSSNINTVEKKTRSKPKRHKSKKSNNEYNKENEDIYSNVNYKDKETARLTEESTLVNNLNESNKNSVVPKSSMKDKLLNKTKNIFDNAFKKGAPKSSNNYVKIFEGELLAELSKFSPTCQSPNNKPPDEENTINSWDFSLERSLKRKYDLKESELHKKKSTKLKHHHHRKKDPPKDNEV